MEKLEILGVAEIMDRYQLGMSAAYKRIREIRAYCGASMVGKGRVTSSEVEAWERYVTRNNPAYEVRHG